MARKKHNPGCPCCGCESNGGSYPGFDNIPTVRIIISGLPDEIGPFYRWARSPGGIWTRHEYYIRDLDLANGTYFWTLEKEGAKCIKKQPYGFLESMTIKLDEEIRTEGSTQCGFVGTTTDLKTPSLTITETIADGDDFGLQIVCAVGGIFTMRGEIEFNGPTFDMSTTTEDNTLIFAGFANLVWPRSSGDIKLRRIALAADTCGISAEDASGLVEGTVGSITAEIIDL